MDTSIVAVNGTESASFVAHVILNFSLFFSKFPTPISCMKVSVYSPNFINLPSIDSHKREDPFTIGFEISSLVPFLYISTRKEAGTESET